MILNTFVLAPLVSVQSVFSLLSVEHKLSMLLLLSCILYNELKGGGVTGRAPGAASGCAAAGADAAGLSGST